MTYAIRTLLKTPSFTAVAIATIALGIAANSAIFSIVNAVLLRPLPFPDERRVVRVWSGNAQEPHGGHSAGEFRDLADRNRSLEAIAGFRSTAAAVAPPRGDAQQVQLEYVTDKFFDVLGTPAARGRTFTAGDGARGGCSVVLSDTGWQELLGRGDNVIGNRVRVNGETCTIAAVMPPAFDWPEGTRVWQLSRSPVPPSPLDLKDPLTNRDGHYFEAVARLKPDVTLAAARQDVHTVATVLQREHPDTDAGRDFELVPIRTDLTGDVRGALLVIQAAVGLVLLIACANVSSLLIARATGRRRELAVRAALGASRADLVWQLLIESVVLGAVGGALGLLAGSWLVVWLVRLLPEAMPRTTAISLDRTVTLVTLGAAFATSLLFGIMPAWQASRADATAAMKQTGERGSSSRGRGRATLVVAEIALTLVLLAGAGLLANSFLRLQRVDPGFTPAHVTIAELAIPQTRYANGPDQIRLYRRLLEGLKSRPEFQAIGLGFPGPLRGSNASATFDIEGRPSKSDADKAFANIGLVSGGYFEAMGIPLVAGRTFTDQDVGDAAPPVAIVSAAFARKYWPGQNAVGRRFRFEANDREPWFTIVGVINDVRQLGLREAAPPLLYLPYDKLPLPFTTVAIRTTLPEAGVASLLRSQLHALDPDLPFTGISTLRSIVDRSVDAPRSRAVLITAFALLALILASVGVYGLISYTVLQRTREIGIRVALGASPHQVLMTVVREGLTLAIAGIVIGLAGAALATRALSAFLFGVSSADPLTFSAVALLMLVVALAASYVPSRRALSVDPVVALRAE